MKTFRISAGWRAGMELECDDSRGQQVYCLTHDLGLEWIADYDALPPPVRSRLARSRFNLCPACVGLEAKRAAGRRRPPPIAAYFSVIAAIEQAIKNCCMDRTKTHAIKR